MLYNSFFVTLLFLCHSISYYLGPHSTGWTEGIEARTPPCSKGCGNQEEGKFVDGESRVQSPPLVSYRSFISPNVSTDTVTTRLNDLRHMEGSPRVNREYQHKCVRLYSGM